MAKKQPITSSAESTFSVPAIVVPDNASTDEYGIDFELGAGLYKVDIHWRRDLEVWNFRGRPEAMLAHGLLRPEWMPGFPGNNITSQIVIFNEDGPSVIHGNLRGARKGKSWLKISRNSRITAFVRYTPPLEQRQPLNTAVDKVRLRRKTEANAASASDQPQSPGAFRRGFLHFTDLAMSLNQAHMAEYKFCFNKESTARINRAFSELRRAIEEAGVQAKPGLHRDGNVIYLGAQPATEVTS